jgi:outer membrane protein assembly factor BamD
MGWSLKIKTIFFLLFFLASCASNRVDIPNEKNPQKLYEHGEKALKEGDYLEAHDAFSEIRKRFSQSQYFSLAELGLADNEFFQDNFAEAAALYGNFVELYPNHKKAAYAQFQKTKALMYGNPMNEARDQSSAVLAAKAASQLLARYPQSEYTKEAQEVLSRARLQLAKKEAYIARFYAKKKKYEASLNRWKKIPLEYKDLKNYEPAQALWKELEVALKDQKSAE